ARYPDVVVDIGWAGSGALAAAAVLSFAAALEAVSARGREMTHLAVDDPGAMAAVSASIEEVERIVEEADGYVVLANVNSTNQLVLGGETAAVEQVMAKLAERG